MSLFIIKYITCYAIPISVTAVTIIITMIITAVKINGHKINRSKTHENNKITRKKPKKSAPPISIEL